jgi:hypothetical protein
LFFFNIKDDIFLRYLLTKQITHLNIDIRTIKEESPITVAQIFGLILSLCKKLTVLNFCDMFPTRKCLTDLLQLPLKRFMSSTLIKLKINVTTLFDCLCLLDGRLDCLSILIIHVSWIFGPLRHRHRLVSLTLIIMLKLNFDFLHRNNYEN